MPGLLALLVAAAPAARAQRVRTLTACTPDALAVCAELRLTAGPAAFELALRTVGAAQAALPVTVYNLVLGTGAPAAAGGGAATLLAPTPVGGAVVDDASAWEVFDAGDALFLSALTNRGVGGCAAGPDVGGFGQAGRTCGAGQFFTFRFAPSGTFDPRRFTLLNLEAVALANGLPAASCGAAGAACVITSDVVTTPGTTVPEPYTAALVGSGILLIGALRRDRARGRGA